MRRSPRPNPSGRPRSLARRLGPLPLLLAMACGGPEPGGVEIGFSRTELAEATRYLALYFYGSDSSCREIRGSNPRLRPALGPFRADVAPEKLSGSVVVRLAEPLPVATYVLFADAHDGDGAILGSGCSPDQKVHEGQFSPMRVVIGP